MAAARFNRGDESVDGAVNQLTNARLGVSHVAATPAPIRVT